MKTAVKSPESAVYRRGLGIFLTETPPPDAPKHLFRPLFPHNPHFPARWSDPMALSGASRRKQITSSRRSLTKKQQFKAYRKWRTEKGLNWKQ